MPRRRGRNEGSIWKEGRSYRAAVSLDGKRMTRSFATRQECKRWIHETKIEIDQGLTYPATRVTLGVFICDWLDRHAPHVRQKTYIQYRQVVRDHILPRLGHHKMRELHFEVIEGLYSQMKTEGVGCRTIKLTHAVLHGCLEDAVKRGLLPGNPADRVDVPRYEHDEMKVLNESQVIQFLSAAKGSPYEALYHLAVKTGMRQGELLGLQWSDLDWTSRTLRVERQWQRVSGVGTFFCPPKTKAGRRTIQLGQGMLQVLKAHLEYQQKLKAFAGSAWVDTHVIFTSKKGTPVENSNMLKDFKAILKKAGLEAIRFHDLRHTAASLMLNHGIPVIVVSRILGHSKPSITLDIYGHLMPVMQLEAAQTMDEIMMPTQGALGKPETAAQPGNKDG
ncbi:MAG: site-specific integrase [Chloroflexota bacterium]|nr:MAG: site-specific integrase [Chloroflexota bacterium]